VHKLENMLRHSIIYCLIIFCIGANAQNDTLYLYKAYIILNGIKYNRLDQNNERTGNWIVYALKDEVSIMVTASGYDPESMKDVHSYTDVIIKYRALNESEKEGDTFKLEERLDTTFNDKRYYIRSEEIHCKIPPDKYYIVAKGLYDRGQKEGVWTYYYESGKTWKQIDYMNDITIN
jgi:hypothetical protein